MKNQISHLVNLQFKLNSLINPNWVEKALDETYDYRTAASQEIAETMESLGYAWWTERPLDMQNVFTELVDAMHFLLSLNIAQVDSLCADEDATCDLISDRVVAKFNQISQQPITDVVEVRKLIRQLQASINTGTIGDIWLSFFSVTQALDFKPDHVYARYVAKNILNTFRQENGYRTGNYKKIWLDGRDDNSHVADFVDGTVGTETFNTEVFKNWLAKVYLEQTVKTTTPTPTLLPTPTPVQTIEPVAKHNNITKNKELDEEKIRPNQVQNQKRK